MTRFPFEHGLSSEDLRWSVFEGAERGAPWDPRAALRRLAEQNDDVTAWDDLWRELQGQGRVGVASYAAVPPLVDIYLAAGRPDWNTYSLVGLIESLRCNEGNPDLPKWLVSSYHDARARLCERAIAELATAQDPPLLRSIIAIVAQSRGLPRLARVALEFTETDLAELLEGDPG